MIEIAGKKLNNNDLLLILIIAALVITIIYLSYFKKNDDSDDSTSDNEVDDDNDYRPVKSKRKPEKKTNKNKKNKKNRNMNDIKNYNSAMTKNLLKQINLSNNLLNNDSDAYEGFQPNVEGGNFGGNYAPFTIKEKRKDKTVEELFDPANLLPKESNDDWFKTYDDNTPISGADFISGSNHIGLSTISGTMKNPNLDIRPTPIVEKTLNLPFNMSTIEPEYNIRKNKFF